MSLKTTADERKIPYLEECKIFLLDYVRSNGRQEEIELTEEYREARNAFGDIIVTFKEKLFLVRR